MKVVVERMGKLVKDQPSWQLQPGDISTGHNIRWSDNQVGSVPGYSQFFAGAVAPYFSLPITDGSTYYWLYMGLAKGYLYNGSTSTDVTRASGGDYTGAATDRWNGCIINGVPVVNNGVDDPQMFTPIGTTTDLQQLTAWTSIWKAKAIRQYKNFLVALNVTKSSTEYPHRVKWSDIADSGTVPGDWDETSTSNLAGENDIAETDGVIIDALQLKDELIIYKEDAVYGMQYIGGNNVFRFRRIRGIGGIMAQQCAVEFKGGHFVVGGPDAGDIYIHDGQSSQSVIDKVMKDFFFSDIDTDNYTSTFVVPNHQHNEILICYPETGQSLPNKALVWNYTDDKWCTRDLPANTTHAHSGIVDVSAYTWDTLPYSTWEEWTDAWGTRQYSPVSKTLVMCSTDTYFYKFEDGNQLNGSNAAVTIERIGLDLGGIISSMEGADIEPGTFTDDVHMVSRIYPMAEGNSFNVYIGSQSSPNSAVDWDGPYAFDPSSDYKIDVRKTGRLHSIRFASEANVQWAITGFALDVKKVGTR